MRSGRFIGCVFVGLLALDVHAQEPEDEKLFNEAASRELAGDIGVAVRLRVQLLDRFPQSDLAEPTLVALARTYAAIAYYDDAAERYEQYAQLYPNSKDAPEALQNAYLFRVGLDQTDAALRDLDEYERLYARKDPDMAARIFWSRSELLDTAKQRREHALEYIQRHGRGGSVDRWLVAEAVVAQIDWRSSCAEPLLFDSCITIDDAVVTVHARKRKLASEAQARFDRILSAIQKSSIQIPEYEYERQRSFLDAWAMALVYQADADYEDFLRLGVPKKLDREGSRLREFVEHKLELGTELAERYAAVKAVRSWRWQSVAMARVGMLYETFADQLDHFGGWAQPLRDKAANAWLYCLVRATEYQYFDEFSRLCELQLAEHNPRNHPAAHELLGEFGHAPTRMRTVGVLTESGVP